MAVVFLIARWRRWMKACGGAHTSSYKARVAGMHIGAYELIKSCVVIVYALLMADEVQSEVVKVAKVLKDLISHMEGFEIRSNARMQNIEDYNKNEATGIEKEAALAVKKHLVDKEYGKMLYVPSGFPKKLFHWHTNAPITDLDGAYVLTEDPDVAGFGEEILDNIQLQTFPPEFDRDEKLKRQLTREAKKLNVGSKEKQKSPQAPFYTQLVIIEAKHHMTVDRIKNKLEQLAILAEYIMHAKNITSKSSETSGYKQKFMKNVTMFKYDSYDPKIRLYFASPYWDDAAKTYLQDVMQSNETYRDCIGLAMPSGSRYAVVDMKNAFAKLQGGGYTSKQRRRGKV